MGDPAPLWEHPGAVGKGAAIQTCPSVRQELADIRLRLHEQHAPRHHAGTTDVPIPDDILLGKELQRNVIAV